MIDLHTHTLFSDGVLLPSELVVRAKNAGYDAIALTDHVDFSNIDFVIKRVSRVADELTKSYKIKVIPGCELTYIPPALIKKAVDYAKKSGAKLVVVHGETSVEPVPSGTNRAAILSGADILAHPGYISVEDIKLAVKRDVFLEITTRKGHLKTNYYVASLAKKYGAKMLLNTDAHSPDDLLTKELINRTIKRSGLSKSDYDRMLKNSLSLIEG